MNATLHRCAVRLLPYISLVILSSARAADTTPPTLNIQQTWIEKVGSVYHFKMNLDPQDDTGVDKIEFRTALNTTSALPASAPWNQHPWTRGQPFDEGFICSAIVIEVRAKDAAGNASPLQRRTFKAPFPLSPPPNLDPQFAEPPVYLTAADAGMDCKGLFTADFDGQGRDDILQVDNGSGTVTVRRQDASGTFTSNTFQLTAGTIQDSAIGDFDQDGLMDIAIVVNNDVMVYHNNGIDGNGILTFTGSRPAGRDNSTIATVEHLAVADFSGDGYPEIAIVGEGDDGAGGTIVRAEVIVNDGHGSLFGFNFARGPTGASAGRIAIGDLNGDGNLDIAMIDKTGRRIVVFKGFGNGTIGGTDDPSPASRPLLISTYQPAEAIAIGDISGSGHSQVVLTEHYFGLLNAPYADGQKHSAELWEYLAHDPTAGLQSYGASIISVGPGTAINTPFTSDLILRDYTDDRFPEIVMTNAFDGSISVVRMTVPLDNQNNLNNGFTPTLKTFATAPNPQRLAAGRRSMNGRFDVIIAGGDTRQVTWLSNRYTTSSKANDIVGGASTDSDPDGTADGNSVLSYRVYPDGEVNYSLTYVNNTASAITGATVQIVLPMTLAFQGGSPGCSIATSKTAATVRWVLDIPANTSGVETLQAKVLATVPGIVIAPIASLLKGTTTLASTTMPRVTVIEPLLFTLAVSTDSDVTGFATHRDEAITYTFNITNHSATAITNAKMGTAFPTGTKFLVASTTPAGITGVPRGVAGKETGYDWTVASLPPNGFYSVFVLVNVTAAENAIITESTATCTRGTTKITAPAFKTTVLPTLGVELSADLAIARPGDFINFTFTVHNFGIGPVNNAKVVDLLPQGVALTSVHTDDGTGNFVDVTLNGDNITLTTNPGIDRTLGLITWTWTSIPAHSQRTVRFTCQVKYDDPTYYFVNNTSVTNGVSNYNYNLVGTLGTGTRLFAAKPVGGAAASSATAASSLLLSTAVPTITSLLSGGDPMVPPNIALHKDALGDGIEIVAGEPVSTVINDPTNASDGVMSYVLTVSNATGAGTATNVQVHDFIPTGMNFVGFVTRDGTPVSSYFGFHFYDANGKEIPGGGEDYTDTNHNGVWNTGEPFVDANGNKKYDGITAIRSFTFPVGDLTGGHSTVYSYRVQTTLLPGGTVISNSGGMSGKFGLYLFDPVVGYHLTASNLNFPANGGPRQLKTIVTAPASFNMPGGIIRSRGEAIGNELTGIAIPFEVLGGTGLTLSGIKMDIPIPKGFLVQAAQLFDKLGNVVATPTPGAPNSLGVRTLSFGINTLRNATALFQVALDPATASVLKNATGQIKAPLSITPTVTGSYAKPAPAGAVARAVSAAASSPPPPQPIAVLAGLGVLPIRADPVAKDAKVFVGRFAPCIVRRGETFTYTIVVGNLTDGLAGFGTTLRMSIPAGTTYVSGTSYVYNFHLVDDIDSGPIPSAQMAEPIVTGGKVVWHIGALGDSEGGVATLTVKVPDTFQGDRIDDNSCTLNLTNALGKCPGSLGVVVASGNAGAQSTTATQGAVEGLGGKFNVDVRNGLDATSFVVNNASFNVTAGGCDIVHLVNDVVLIPLKHNRMMVIGPADKVNASGIRLLHDGMMRVAVGPGTLAGGIGVGVSTLPGLSGVPPVTPNSLIIGMGSPTSSLIASGGGSVVATGGGNVIAAGGGNIIAAGGGNIIAAGGGNLIGSDGTGLIGANASMLLLPEGNAPILAKDIGGKLVTDPGAAIIAAGGGNVVATGGGNVIATGGGNLIGTSGSTLIGNDGAGVVSAGAGNLIGQDGAGVIAAGGGNLVSTNGGNVINLNGIASLANIK